MKPSVPLVLAAAARRCEDLLQGESDAVRAADLARFRVIFSVIARDWDSATVDRVRTIATATALLQRGLAEAPAPLASELAATLKGSITTHQETMSVLDQKIDESMQSVERLQAYLEEAPHVRDERLLGDIWAFLASHTQRIAVLESIW